MKISKKLSSASADWTMLGGNIERMNFTDTNLKPPFTPVWEYRMSSNCDEGPFTVYDSVLFVVNLKGEIHAVNITNGQKVGKINFGKALSSAPTIEPHNLFITSSYGDESLAKYDISENKFDWKINLKGIETSPLILGNDVYVTTLEGKLVCINKRRGDIKWSFSGEKTKAPKPSRSSPASDGNIIIYGRDDGSVYGVNIDSTLKWKFIAQGSIRSTPTISGNKVLFSSTDGFFYSLDLYSGNLNWVINIGSPAYSSQAVWNNYVNMGTSDGIVRCLDSRNGRIIWKFQTKGPISASPMASKDFIYVSSLDKKLYVLNAETGNLEWSYLFQGRIKTTPLIWNEYIIIASDDKVITALKKNEEHK